MALSATTLHCIPWCLVPVPGTPNHSTDAALTTSPGQAASLLGWRKDIKKNKYLRINENSFPNFSLSSQVFDENVIEEEIGTKRENDSLWALCHTRNMKDEKGKKETKEREEIIQK